MPNRKMGEAELKRLGKNLKRLRKALSMNQTALAYKAKTRPTTISSLENGINPNPGWDLLNRIAKVLNTSIHSLTQPETSTFADEKSSLPPGLVNLLRDQDELLAPTEERISLREVEWLKKVPVDRPEWMESKDYLMILRHFRLMAGDRFAAAEA